MKKIILIATAALFALATNSWAQRLIALEHGTQITLYSRLDTTLVHAQNGDIIYIPGGTFDITGNISITKKLRIYGVGHYPDSTTATNPTILTGGSLYIKTGADSGSISGIYFTGNVYFGSTSVNQVVNNYTISRCCISYLQLAYNASSTNTAQNIVISENVIRGETYGGNIQTSLFEKNIFNSCINYINGATIKNNIFPASGTSSYVFQTAYGCVMENNIFKNTSAGYIFPGSTSGNSYYNNLFVVSITFPYNGCTGVGNITGVNTDSIFVNQTGVTFNYSHNYHLKSTSAGKNAGTDGTDIGIYGTSAPYKEGAVPENPHIQYKSIAPQTNSNGKLNINIKTRAQER
ncbi:MAG: hypothetical protein PHD97_03260 [Bacteroidales bacterium]|nr:hypothetical protein [Bacteroidales bacterium]